MNFIHLSKQAYPLSSCRNLIQMFEDNLEHAEKGSMGVGVEKLDDLELGLEIQSKDSYWGLGKSLAKAIGDFVSDYPLVNTAITKWKLDNRCQLMRYEPNNFYKEVHCENDGTPQFLNRVFAWMVYLNTIKEGGGTHFVYQNFTAQPIAGDIYVWPAHWTHMHYGVVAPYEKKYIITGWVSYIQ